MARFLSLGHSNHSIGTVIGLLRDAGATAVADVRSSPSSRFCPQFNRTAFSARLEESGVRYVFLGAELGGRPVRHELYEGAVANYPEMARTPQFLAGIDRLTAGAAQFTIALVCAEADPLHCHRCLLVGRHLCEHGHDLDHIHADGHLESHADAELRMMKDTAGLPDMFDDRSLVLTGAYRTHNHRYGFRRRQ